ncbi:DUF2145 domain-containing protein [Paraglaciecola aquimarina]|uniref:DUF2145 domain-containing protein n=1 Tax=Paraglaciecola algarum TaxID=3050085 RepID=A0ABS9D7I3_9ALTE|nr:DUF2145 domain-containing protein [Paraglaciecola sp. G1-23]MCF2948913.1 DUF2145 domain-containing protein [Paraglaciecola sp. G1-23]
MNIEAIIVVLLLLSPTAWAGSQSAEKATFEPETIKTFAKDVEKYAAAQGARAFIIARVGRPEKELPKGIKYTHTAIAVYSNIELETGETVQGYAIHNLYQNADKPNRSELIMDYPVDFFWGAQQLKAGIIIPTTEVQQGLIKLIAEGKNTKLHNPKYSVIANPLNSRFQNCTEHTLDMLNAAIYQTTNIKQLKANAKAHFTPQRVKTNPLKLMFGSMLMKDVTTKDHPRKVATATFSSINRYLAKYQLVHKAVEFYSAQRAVAI